MSMFFRYKGSLSFATAEEAKKYYDLLVKGDDSWFAVAPKELTLSQATLTIKSKGNFNSYISCENTKDFLYEAARNAQAGSIDVDEGDSEDNLWNREKIPASGKKKQEKKSDPSTARSGKRGSKKLKRATQNEKPAKKHRAKLSPRRSGK